MDTFYNIIDFRAVLKHAYYGADCPESIFCEETGRHFPRWETGAQGFISRYIEPILAQGGSPRTLLVAHDMGREYRTAVYPGYKAKKENEVRSPVETEQVDKLFDWAKKFLAAMGATQIGVKGVEADDVIAWLCQGIVYPKAVYTVDADLLQLVNDKTCIYLKQEPHFGEGEHKDTPYHLTSIAKSILGDTSDHYPGIKGIGPAKFAELLANYGADGIEQLRDVVDSGDPTLLDEAIAQTGDKILIKIRESFGEWRTMWRLAKLHPELCWKPRAKKLVVPTIHKRVPDAQQLFDLLKTVGADDLWDSTFAACAPSKLAITADNWAEMKDAILSEIEAGDITAFDYEGSDKTQLPGLRQASTQGDKFVDVLSQELAGCSFQFGRHLENVIYIPVDHKDSPNLPKTVLAEVIEHAARRTTLVAHNATFEGVVTQTNLHMELRNVHDTRMMQRYVNENMEAGLKTLSAHYLGYTQATYEETVGDKANMAELTLDEVFDYGADDALVTGLLYDLLKLLLQLDNQWEFYCRWAVNPTVVLQHSYINGVNINWPLQKRLHERDLKQVEEGMAELRQILEDNVTGNITPGCESFIEAEKDYIFRSWKKKLDGDSEAAKAKLFEWKTKQEHACQYVPYRTETVMPAFALTAKQLSAAAEAVGLPAVEKVTEKALTEYLGNQGMLSFEPQEGKTPEQMQMLTAISEALGDGALKIKALEAKVEKFSESLETAEDKELVARSLGGAEKALAKARAAFDALGEVVQRLAGVEPKMLTFGDELNVGSPVQMQQLLYCKIGVPVRLRGKSAGKGRLAVGITEAGPSTDETAIQTALANDIEKGGWQEAALKALLKVKSASTRISLYHDKYPLWRHLDGKLHPSFTDAGTDTRRPTGSSPNVLQVSKKDKSMRSMFVPPAPDWVVVAIDYNGQELRLLACESGDPVMIDAYDPADEKDLHSVTGSGIAKLKATTADSAEARQGLATISDFREFNTARSLEDHPLNKIADGIRKKAKGVNFGLAYGAGASTLSRNLIVPIAEAEELLEGAMSLYARIPQWQKETAQFMEKNGFTLTAFGTKRHATEDIFSKDHGKVSRQHRQGTNATIQGTAAEMLRIVLTGIVERDLLNRLRMVFFAPIYDETVAFVHKDDVVEYCREMHEIMSGATPPGHAVRQMPEISIGPDWGRVHELGRWEENTPETINAVVERCIEEAKEMWAVDMAVPFEELFPKEKEAA